MKIIFFPISLSQTRQIADSWAAYPPWLNQDRETRKQEVRCSSSRLQEGRTAPGSQSPIESIGMDRSPVHPPAVRIVEDIVNPGD